MKKKDTIIENLYKKTRLIASRYVDHEYYACICQNIKDMFDADEWSFVDIQLHRAAQIGCFIGLPISLIVGLLFSIWIGFFIFFFSLLCESNSSISEREFSRYLWSTGTKFLNRKR